MTPDQVIHHRRVRDMEHAAKTSVAEACRTFGVSRAIPPSDPEYRQLYSRRSDAESINRALDDSSWLGRAHSKGRDRQLLNLLGYAIAVNSIALHRHRRVAAPPGELAA